MDHDGERVVMLISLLGGVGFVLLGCAFAWVGSVLWHTFAVLACFVAKRFVSVVCWAMIGALCLVETLACLLACCLYVSLSRIVPTRVE